MQRCLVVVVWLTSCSLSRPIDEQIYAGLAHVQNVNDDASDYTDAAIEGSFSDRLPETLLVLIGGHSSCAPGPLGQVMVKPFFAMRRDLLNSGHTTSFLLSCYGPLSYQAYTQRSHDLGHTRTVDNDTVIDLVIAEARQTSKKQVAIIGHSYGGWLALQIALALPTDLKLLSLTTIDPISQKVCRRHNLGIRTVSAALGDDVEAACQRFPDDVDQMQRARLAEGALWRNYFQKQTTLLRSGPVSEAQTNTLVDQSHGRICLNPPIWRRLARDIVEDRRPIDPDHSEKMFSSGQIETWVATERRMHPAPPLSELSLRIFSRYAKSEFALYPPNRVAAVKTFQPNLRPSLGVAVQFTPNHALSVSRSLDFLPTRDDKVKTRVSQYDYRFTQRRWAADAFFHEFLGLIRTEGSKGDVRPFQDALFQAMPPGGNRSSMRLRAFGFGALWLFNPHAVSLPAMLTQKERHAGNDWSFVVDGSYRQLAVSDSNDADVPPFRVHTLSVLPGFAGSLVVRDYFLSGTGVWGPAYRLIAGQSGNPFAQNGSARLSVGRNSLAWFAGISGQKRVTSADGQIFNGLGLTDTYSSVEVYAGQHF